MDFGDLNPDLIDAVKGFEGYTPRPQGDYQQYSSGWGTKARPGEAVDRATHEQRLRDELEKAATFVDTKVPGLPQGVRDAMISLTFNAGGNWANAGLGQKLREGDYTTAQQLFTQYNKASGKPLQGLTNRRNTEASWFDEPTASRPPFQADDLGSIAQQPYGRTRMDETQQQPPGLLGMFGGGQQGGVGGLIGAIDPQKMAYLGMIAKGLDPYSSIDPNSMLKNAQADQIARMRLAQTQQEHELDRQIRQGQLGLNTRAQDRQDAEFQYRQQQLDEARKAGTEIYGAAGQPDTGGLTRENIFKYMQQYPNMDKSTRDFLESRLSAIENQGKITRDTEERRQLGQQQGLQGKALDEYVLTGKVSDKPPLTSTQERLLSKAEDELPAMRSTLDNLKEAADLTPKSYEGFGAEARAGVMSRVPNALRPSGVDFSGADATARLTQILNSEGIRDMSRTMKGATSDREMQKWLSTAADVSLPIETRKIGLQRAIALYENEIRTRENRIDQLRGGGYDKPGGGASAPRQGGGASGSSQQAPDPLGIR